MKHLLANLREALAARQQFLHQAEALRPHLPQLYAAFAEREMAPLTHHERELLENALAFGALVADDVAVPRAEIIAAKETASLPEVLALFAESQHSRLPVVGNSLDDLKGFVLLKDVIQHLQEPATFQLSALLRPLTVVPETMPLPRVLQQMKRAKVPFVLVADEFGGTSGLISLKDILEQLVGSIADENADQAEAIVSLGGQRYRIRGETALTEVD
ncbi:MAG: CBS domain-containing protein, partial [Alphaproteobacteria bacterium]|nr:CBS domain-containing protein [Alphaproteobacteria bacterium]